MGDEVVGYSPDGGYLIRGRPERKGQRVTLGVDDVVEVHMANMLDRRVFGAGVEDPVVFVRPRLHRYGTVRRYLARYSEFEFASAQEAHGRGGRHE